jgi:hypothetical protein
LFGSTITTGLSTARNLQLFDRGCLVDEQANDCKDADGDGYMQGVERKAGSRDDSLDSDADDIPDNQAEQAHDRVPA